MIPVKFLLLFPALTIKANQRMKYYEFSLSDMNKQMVDFKVSGKNVEVTLSCKNKEKLVKVYKNGVQQAWGSDVAIGTNDVETAKNIAAAFS
jgi:hypothetical protein